MSNLDKIIFGEKKLSDLFQEIYNNQKKKDTQITSLINELKPLVTDIGDATLIVPLIKEYLDMGIKNDDILIKLAQIASKLEQAIKDNNGSFNLSEEEKDNLLKNFEELSKDNK